MSEGKVSQISDDSDRVIKEERLRLVLFIQVELALTLVKKNKNMVHYREHYPGVVLSNFNISSSSTSNAV